MSEAEERRRELESRNAGLRGQIDSMLSDLRRRTAELGEKRAEAAQRTTEVTSEDGMVTVEVDAAGTLTELTLAPKAFERSTPDRLARTITTVIREASGTAQRGLQETFAPLAEGGPDLPEVVPGLPGFKDALGDLGPLVEAPDPAAERARRIGDPPPAARGGAQGQAFDRSAPAQPGAAPSEPPKSGPPQPGPQQPSGSGRGRRAPADDDDDQPGSFLVGGKW